eukprot:maker-scaffold_4-snap-gene-3.6-mRNA-1 protein AED:0.18 eAED:0.19 QI:0/0/0/1/1/1/2/0/399
MEYKKYHQAEKLGEGSFGSVCTVYDVEGNCFAMKVFEADEYDETIAKETVREISVLRLLRTVSEKTGIILLHDIMINEYGEFCAIIPKLSLNLSQAIESKLPFRKLPVYFSLLSTLDFLHSHHIIHRDIKLDNILLTETYQPVLIDFSLSKLLATSDGSLCSDPIGTHTGDVGTAKYIAPEVYQKDFYSFNSDVYSLGVVFLELFLGRVLAVERDKAAFSLILDLKKNVDEKSEKRQIGRVILRMLESDISKRGQAGNLLDMEPLNSFNREKIVDLNSKKFIGVRGDRIEGDSRKLGEIKKLVFSEVWANFLRLEFERWETLWAGHVYYCNILRRDDIEDRESFPPYCLILASKIYELQQYDQEGLEELDINMDIYIEAEKNIFLAMDCNLYVEAPRSP